MIPRRRALAALAAAAGITGTPRTVVGQTAGAPKVVGVLVAGGPGPGYIAFVQGLADLGYVEGSNLRIEARFAESEFSRLPGLAAELVSLRVDAIFVIGAPAARPTRQRTADIPILFAVVIDPVGAGLVTDQQRPGGNMTGATNFDPREPGHHVELLKQVLPRMTRLALLAEADIAVPLTTASRAAAEAAGLDPLVVQLRGSTPDLDAAFALIAEGRADALLALSVPSVFAHAERIAEIATRARLPTMFGRDLADRGPMLAFGTSLAAVTRHVAGLVDRVLRGARPGDLPIEVVSRPELVVNMRVARAIGVAVPPAVLAWAHEVID